MNNDVEWLPYTSLEFTKQLSSGSSGQVYKGYFANTEVAIKVLEKQKGDLELEEFKHEFKALRYLYAFTISHQSHYRH